MARFLGFRRYAVPICVLIMLFQVFIIFQTHYQRDQDSIKNNRELWYLFKNLSLQESKSISVDQQSDSPRVGVTAPQIIARSWDVSTGIISINSSYESTTGIKKRTTLNITFRQENVPIKQTNHQIKPTLPSWIPANIINLSMSNISDIYECNLPASENNEKAANKKKLQICPCVPNNLEKHIFYDEYKTATYEGIRSKYKDVSLGGHWAPQTCVPRHSIAIIIPYRDREDHLIMFLDYMHRLLQKQLLDYTIIIAEQGSPSIFNKAKIMNAAYMESKKIKSFDCYFFHDIDMLAEDERNLYTCPSMPRHQGVAADKFSYRLFDSRLIGGVAVYRPEHFELVNGYSNKFWGWGGEDDNMYRRVVAKQLKILRPPDKLARYTMIKHEQDKGNPRNAKRGG